MNTEINNVAIASLGVSLSIRKIRLQEGAAMAGLLVLGLIKFLMMFTPFLSLLMMMLALWGVVGKITYTDIEDTARQGVALSAKEAKNYLVNEMKNIEQCPEELKITDIAPPGENPRPQKIDWAHVA